MSNEHPEGAKKAHSSPRLPVLDGLRAISILLVLAGHMLPLGPKILALNETAATMGMSLFFGLSGFLIASGLLHNPSLPEFVVKRFSKIVPLAYGYLLLTYTFIYFDPADMLWTATFLVNYFPDHLNNYNAHFWSLCVEVQFYAAIAGLVFFFGQRSIWLVWPACLAVTAMRVSEGAYVHIQTHLRVDEILIGSCLATLYHTVGTRHLKGTTILLVGTCLLWCISSSPYFGWCQYLRPYATGSFMGAAICLDGTLVFRVLSSRPLRYIATISYALYIIHPLTVQGWFNTGGPLERYLLKRPISFTMTFVAAHLSTFYWERPWLQAGRQWIAERRTRKASMAA